MACVIAECRVAARIAVSADAYPLDRIHPKKTIYCHCCAGPWGLVQCSALTVSCAIQSVEVLWIRRTDYEIW
jgi:hypothetical protein